VSDQEIALKAIEAWYRDGFSPEFRMGGLAGTGKTTIIAQLPSLLRLNALRLRYVAPTGKAASVLSKKLPYPYVATTIHRLMYLPREHHCAECVASESENCHGQGDCGCGVSFEYHQPEPTPSLVVVDEASMVTEAQHRDLESIGCRVLYVGDHGQLPPVMGNIGLMDEEHLDVRLERVFRQVADSPILRLAMMARNGEPIDVGEYGPGVQVVRGKNHDVEADVDTLLLCYTNKMRVQHNAMMRFALGLPPGKPVVGDKVLCLKNNNDVGIANGMLGILENIEPSGMYYYRVVIQILGEERRYRGRILAQQFQEDKTMLVRGADLWTFGYCLTAHKAQGSEADDVIVFRESSMWRMSPDDQRRWLYTAITRAKKTLTIVT
jgi:exodeoxyribonuclease-5